jgi:acetyltransferase-like isoleucine patch superfamily enzyme
VTICDDVGIGAGVRILASQGEAGLPHATSAIPPILIGELAQIGVGATILSGTSIEAGARIEPGCVVNHDVAVEVLDSRNSEAA